MSSGSITNSGCRMNGDPAQHVIASELPPAQAWCGPRHPHVEYNLRCLNSFQLDDYDPLNLGGFALSAGHSAHIRGSNSHLLCQADVNPAMK
jgi:hypothetical protein